MSTTEIAAETLFRCQETALGHGAQAVLSIKHLQINAGEKVAILGASGTGKSTLLDHLYQQRPEQIAYCPQQLGLVPILSVLHNIYMGQLHRHPSLYNLLNLLWPQSQPKTAITAIAEQVGLADKLLTSVDQLSGGQQQRTALARALYRQADIFIGDEPVSAIDPLQAKALVEHLLFSHTTVIVALHDRQLALDHFDRIIGIQQGRIVLDAPSDSLTLAALAELYRD